MEFHNVVSPNQRTSATSGAGGAPPVAVAPMRPGDSASAFSLGRGLIGTITMSKRSPDWGGITRGERQLPWAIPGRRAGSACHASGGVPRFWARYLDARHASGAYDKDVLLANPAGLADPHDDSGSNTKAPVVAEPVKKVDRSGRPTAAPRFGSTVMCRLGSDGPSSEGTTMAAAFEEDGRVAGGAVYGQDERLRVCWREGEGPLHRDGYRSPNTDSHRCGAGGRRGEVAVPVVGRRDSVRTRRSVADRAEGRRGRCRQRRAATQTDRPSVIGEHDPARRRK